MSTKTHVALTREELSPPMFRGRTWRPPSLAPVTHTGFEIDIGAAPPSTTTKTARGTWLIASWRHFALIGHSAQTLQVLDHPVCERREVRN